MVSCAGVHVTSQTMLISVVPKTAVLWGLWPCRPTYQTEIFQKKKLGIYLVFTKRTYGDTCTMSMLTSLLLAPFLTVEVPPMRPDLGRTPRCRHDVSTASPGRVQDDPRAFHDRLHHLEPEHWRSWRNWMRNGKLNIQ